MSLSRSSGGNTRTTKTPGETEEATPVSTRSPPGEERCLLKCEGTNDGEEIRSTVTAGFSLDDAGGIVVEIDAVLEVRPGKTWSVTYNPKPRGA